jgi:uncharacterized protein (TIGR03492 family)
MNSKKKVLFLSNGHGEDQIAAIIIEKLIDMKTDIIIKAMPIVGKGKAYEATGADIICTDAVLPTGGFMRLGVKNFFTDLKAGLIRLTIKQARILKKLKAETDLVVACGDVFLLLMAGLFVKKPIIFYVAAKSEYVNGHFGLEKLLIRAFASRVFTRDMPTAVELSRFGIHAEFLGNPVLDCINAPQSKIFQMNGDKIFGYLPGTRIDVYHNIQVFLDIIEKISLQNRMQIKHMISIFEESSLKQIENIVCKNKQWYFEDDKINDTGVYKLRKGEMEVYLVVGRFGDIIHECDIIVGLSGTGNEQAAGCGKPIISFPTKGTQYNKKFISSQKKLMGKALAVVENEARLIIEKIFQVLSDAPLYEEMSRAGIERMGEKGGAERIARQILKSL